MKCMFKQKFWLSICLAFSALFLSNSLSGNPEPINKKPFVIPELQKWQGGSGYFTPDGKTALVIVPTEAKIQKSVETFAKDYRTMFGKTFRVKTGKEKAGDIVFSLTDRPELGKEGYSISIGDRVQVTANTPQGIFWATRTLLQLAEQHDRQALPKGTITDYPAYEIRGFMLDCGRKFFSIDFLRDYVRMMAYYKMNTFQIHLNDNGFKQYFGNDWMKTYSAFRLECDTYPGLTAKDGSYTKKEFIDLQKMAEEYGVNIIPEIDVPAHSLAFTQYKPEIGSLEYGMDHLDLFKQETYDFVDGLFAEYLSGDEPVFRGPVVHIGTDEYSNKKKDVVEKFRYFTDHYIRLVESYGKKACLWGALTHAKGDTPVKSENVLMNCWYNGYADPKAMAEKGYELISIPDGWVYIVPIAGYYYDYLNTRNLYENWTPARIGNVTFSENDPAVKGGMFAVWNDHVGNGITAQDVHHRVLPAMQTLSAKTWTAGRVSLPYDEFDRCRQALSEAPGVNVAGKIGDEPGLVYETARLRPGRSTPYPEIGYDYTVEFDITNRDTEKGVALFRSPHAVFYLTDPETGKLGFEREGYLNTFDYVLPAGTTHIAICGNSVSTKLYVNGVLKESLDIQKKIFNEKDVMYYIQTLVFPLAQTGKFKSDVRNLKIYNYVK